MAGESLTWGRARRILILAPHPDDEIVACGIAARRARAAGARLFVLYLTTGIPPREDLLPWHPFGYGARIARRHAEAREATHLFGIEPAGFLLTASRGLIAKLDETAAAVERVLASTAADTLWVPAFEGAHQDHDAANALAASFSERIPTWEFAAYNYFGGKVQSNRFIDARSGPVEFRLGPNEVALKRRGLGIYASERGNLAHIETESETCRPLPRYDYAAPPHPGTLFRERFHWVPVRHPRVDFLPSPLVYAALGGWVAGPAAQRLVVEPALEHDGFRLSAPNASPS